MYHFEDRLVIRILGKYKTKINPVYDKDKGIEDDRLWIMGQNVNPDIESEEERIM